jgi:hypothetical protein
MTDDKGPVKVEKPDYPLPKWDRKKPDEFGPVKAVKNERKDKKGAC